MQLIKRRFGVYRTVQHVHTCFSSVVVNCHKGYLPDKYKSTCKSYPSQPRNIKHSFHFNKEIKELSLNLSWDQPAYGKSVANDAGCNSYPIFFALPLRRP